MEGLLAAFDDMSIAKSPFDLAHSTLLAELLALKQPLHLRCRKSADCQFYLNLDEPIFRHAKMDKIKSRTIFVEKNKTDNERVVLFGKTEGGHLWKVKCTRSGTKNGSTRYKADVSVGSKRFRHREVHAAPELACGSFIVYA
nr:hypothetical protein [Pandoravirus massiliensis]